MCVAPPPLLRACAVFQLLICARALSRFAAAMRRLTADLPGSGGILKSRPEDFIVEEIPAYLPAGDGQHTFLWVEKRELNSEEMAERLCRALSVKRAEVGLAGMKDRQAITRQWISLPAVEPERALALQLDNIVVLQAKKHGNKLRTGHLRGNRFIITLRDTSDGFARAQAVLAQLGDRGIANFFGPQRFGGSGDNATQGRHLLSEMAANKSIRLGKHQRRLLISALQAELFNQYLAARYDDGLLDTVLLGDVLKKTDTGGMFTVDDCSEPQQRLDTGRLAITGPIFGHSMTAPKPATPAAQLEAKILEQANITTADFAAAAGIAEGSRRPLRVPISEPVLRDLGDRAIEIAFGLPPGSYATVLLDEIMKP